MSRILILDDEESIRFTLESFLSAEGYKVDTAASFDEAMELLGRKSFDLVFADILLGGETGIDFLREAKQKNPLCPVVMITGAPNVETASEALRLGAFDYVAKPVRKHEILHVASVALRYRKMADEAERYRSNLEAIMRSVPEGLITIDSRKVITEVNDAASRLCGLSGEEAIGKDISVLFASCSGKCGHLLLENMETRRPSEVYRIDCRLRNGRTQVVTLTTAPLLDYDDRYAGAVLVIRDETRIDMLERHMEERRHFHRLVGASEGMQGIYRLIETLADVDTTVLITGESGTGKELVAEALHYQGLRKDKPVVKVNCSALPESLLESELFGHVKGAFTGAISDKVGRFQLAHGGTILLDEIGDIPPRLQLRLLRVLQEKEFERVGDSRPVKVDVRIISSTNRNLRDKIRRGEFREDLFFRLKVMELPLPPLRERREDIPLLVDHFLRKFCMKLNKRISNVSDEALARLMEAPWPGNVRELEHAIEHAFILCGGPVIDTAHLPPELRSPATGNKCAQDLPGPQMKDRILQAIEKTGGNKAKAARLLGISRRTLYRKMEEYGISLDEERPKANGFH